MVFQARILHYKVILGGGQPGLIKEETWTQKQERKIKLNKLKVTAAALVLKKGASVDKYSKYGGQGNVQARKHHCEAVESKCKTYNLLHGIHLLAGQYTI